jgi:hypothetical protein
MAGVGHKSVKTSWVNSNGSTSGQVCVFEYLLFENSWAQVGLGVEGENASDRSGTAGTAVALLHCQSIKLSNIGSRNLGACLNDGAGSNAGQATVEYLG